MVVGCIGLLLLINILITPISGLTLKNIKAQKPESFMPEKTNIILTNNLKADLKIRKTGEDWTDESISAKVGDTLEFKITVETETEYEIIGIQVELPIINNKPMFIYRIGSINPKPDILKGEGIWLANNTHIIWAWFNTEPYWSEEMTFYAKIDKAGSGSIDLTVVASKKNNYGYDDDFDSIQITAEKNKPTYKLKNAIKKFGKYFMLLDECPLLFRFYEKLLAVH